MNCLADVVYTDPLTGEVSELSAACLSIYKSSMDEGVFAVTFAVCDDNPEVEPICFISLYDGVDSPISSLPDEDRAIALLQDSGKASNVKIL